MAYKCRLVFGDGEVIEVADGYAFDTYDEAFEAGEYEVSCLHEGNEIIAMSGDDEYSTDEPEIEVYED